MVARYLSPHNPDSPVASGLFAVSQLKLSSVGSLFTNLGSLFHSIGAALSLPFTHRALAATSDNGYVAADVADIPTYDFPSQCYNLDPLTAAQDPTQGTNAVQVLAKYGIKVPAVLRDTSWDGTSTPVQTNSTQFYQTVYTAIDTKYSETSKTTATSIAQQIYNCNLLDNAVRGDLGNVYGYTDDNGLDGGGDGVVTGTAAVSGNAQQLASQILANSKIDTTSGRLVQEDLQDAAAGKPSSAGAPLSTAILKLIATLGQNHSFTISALESGGTGHANDSQHYSGDAVDISVFDGTSLTGRDSASLSVIKIAETVLPSGSRFGQQGCNNVPSLNLPAGFSEIADTCNHLHIDVPDGTP